jgi:hypothetical protein
MKKRLLGCAIGLVSLCGALTGHGALSVATWGFDNPWDGAVRGASTTIDGTGSSWLTSKPTLEATDNSNTTLSRTPGISPDWYMHFYQSAIGNPWLNGTYFTLKVTAAQYSLYNFQIQYLARGNAAGTGGAPLNSWQYSLNSGTSWLPATALTASIGTTWASKTVSFAGVSVAANSSIWFRDTLGGANGPLNGGYADFNNLTIMAVPEPVNLALGVFGLCVVGVGAGQLFCNRAKRVRARG